jgi:serine/threonine protein kinase
MDSRELEGHIDYELILLAAGNFTVGGKGVNLAKFQRGAWSFIDAMDLHTFKLGDGVIRDMSVVHGGSESGKIPFELFVVGNFDTSTKSQLDYCSVGVWDGSYGLNKVGQGLCPRGSNPDSVAQMYASVIAETGDSKTLFVAGNFASKIWDGKHFIDAINIASFDMYTNAWSPLTGFQLFDDHQLVEEVAVTALAWSKRRKELYVGGDFHIESYIPYPEGRVDRSYSRGIAVWTEKWGLMPFKGGSLERLGEPAIGVGVDPIDPLSPLPPGLDQGPKQFDFTRERYLISHLFVDERTDSFIVSGNFDLVAGQPCKMAAMWSFRHEKWHCLHHADEYDDDMLFETVSAAYKDRNGDTLYLAGKVKQGVGSGVGLLPGHDWAIATLDMTGYAVDADADAPDNDNDNDEGGGGDHQAPHLELMTHFKGADGPIQELLLGHGALAGFIIAAGKFRSGSSVLFVPLNGHSDDDNGDGDGVSAAAGAGNQSVHGTVMRLAQVWVPVRKAGDDVNSPFDTDPGRDIIEFSKDNFSALIIVGLLVGGCLGVCCAYYYFKSSFNYAELGGYDDHDHDLEAVSMSLRTLSSDGYGKAQHSDNFQKIFRQAMQARHLPTHETLRLIDPAEIILSRIIGEGSFGRVWSGNCHNNRVAVKEFVFAQAAVAGETSQQRNRIIEEIVGEAGIMSCLRHPKILQIYGCSLTMQAIWITSELCSAGSLKMFLSNTRITSQLTFLQELSLCLDVADGCHYLHTRNPPIVHRDLKSHNILIQETSSGNYVAKIGDWGSARALNVLADSRGGTKNQTRGIGTACWLAPEVINSGCFGVGSDVYSYGIILWEVMTRKEVYAGLTAEQIIVKVANTHLRPQCPANLPLRDIMASCWRHEPQERPSFHVILSALSKAYTQVKGTPSARGPRVVSSWQEPAVGGDTGYGSMDAVSASSVDMSAATAASIIDAVSSTTNDGVCDGASVADLEQVATATPSIIIFERGRSASAGHGDGGKNSTM